MSIETDSLSFFFQGHQRSWTDGIPKHRLQVLLRVHGVLIRYFHHGLHVLPRGAQFTLPSSLY
jgi:hypothetical protein